MSETEVAIVTGGIQGIGAAITKEFLKRGYGVVAADVQDENGKLFEKEQQQTYGESKIFYFHCDVTKLEDFKALFEFTLKEFKGVDVLVNNAGVICEENPQLLVNINLMGPIYGIQTALQYMGKSKGGKGGTVVNIASIAGFRSHPKFPAYCATKHAVVGLTRSYGHPYYLEKEGILFCALCPMSVRTDMQTTMLTVNPDVPFPNRDPATYIDSQVVAQGVMQLLEDKINGSTAVLTLKGKLLYVEPPQEMKSSLLES